MNQLQIVEINYSVSPGGTNLFEVYDNQETMCPPIFESEDLTKTVQFCYDLGVNFEVLTYAQWERENNG